MVAYERLAVIGPNRDIGKPPPDASWEMHVRTLVHTGLVLAAGVCAPSLVGAQEQHAFSFSQVAGNTLAWSCKGSDGPTMALIAGGGLNAHDSFGRIYHSYDGPGRICMYDRAGIGESKFSEPHTRTLDDLVAELHDLSVNEHWGDLVLVAHSFGGFIARAFADKYPDEVLGLLLMDVAHEDWVPQLEAKMSSGDWAIMEEILAWNTRTFHEDYLEAQESVRGTKLKGGLPITVLSRGIPHTTIRVARMSYDGVDLYEAEHQALQNRLPELSSNSEHRVAKYASHIFDDYDPWFVIDEIELLLNRITEE
jgi:pimeloyl-ACP methyl ester carboxylesterase